MTSLAYFYIKNRAAGHPQRALRSGDEFAETAGRNYFFYIITYFLNFLYSWKREKSAALERSAAAKNFCFFYIITKIF